MKNVGVLGAGQLGRMLALAGFPLGFRFCFLDPTANSPASEFAPQIVAPFEPGPGLDELVSRSDVLTFEFENVPVSMVEPLVGKIPVYPPPKALSPSQDRLLEKQLFRKLGMETVAFRAVDSMESCLQAVQELGLPLVLKTRRLGYDGKGQKRAHSLEEAKAAFLSLASSPLIAEAFLPFDRGTFPGGSPRAKGGLRVLPPGGKPPQPGNSPPDPGACAQPGPPARPACTGAG